MQRIDELARDLDAMREELARSAAGDSREPPGS
jgi:hypothetical protein